jgi:hypothetical protein
MSTSVYRMERVTADGPPISNLDYFILSSGSDSRAYQILSQIQASPTSGTKIILFNYRERVANRSSDDPLFNYRNLAIADLQEVDCDIKNPSSSLSALEANTFNETKGIAVDISCFTKPYFFFLLKLLRERFGVLKIDAYYTEPQFYSFEKGVFTAFHTSSGPLSIIEIPGYSGQERRDAARKLIILLGFDGDLSREINEDVSPGETVVINGFPAYSPKFKDISLIANEKLVSDHNIRVAYARANHPFEVYNLLAAFKKEASAAEGDTFINVAPLGTKPMALGACLFALHNPEVRVVYPLPETYKDKYSDACWSSWVYELPLA